MIQIAIMGFGTVGTGVARVVEENAGQIQRRLGEPLAVKRILVRRFKDGPFRSLMTDDFSQIEGDQDIRVVVETIGGVEAAYEYTRRALCAGKHVVTANKQLVAEKGGELLALAEQVRGILSRFPPNDPAVAELKASPVYQRVAPLIEGIEAPVFGGLPQ